MPLALAARHYGYPPEMDMAAAQCSRRLAPPKVANPLGASSADGTRMVGYVYPPRAGGYVTGQDQTHSRDA